MTAYSVLLAGITLTLHRHEDVARSRAAEWEVGLAEAWRHRVVSTVAIVLWLLTWLGGWWIGRMLSSGSFVPTMAGAVLGWCAGLGVATLVFYLDERL